MQFLKLYKASYILGGCFSVIQLKDTGELRWAGPGNYTKQKCWKWAEGSDPTHSFI